VQDSLKPKIIVSSLFSALVVLAGLSADFQKDRRGVRWGLFFFFIASAIAHYIPTTS
jgi:hypothetical protein